MYELYANVWLMLVQINEKDVYKVGVSYGWCDMINKYIENRIKMDCKDAETMRLFMKELSQKKKSCERKEKEYKMKCLDQRNDDDGDDDAKERKHKAKLQKKKKKNKSKN